MQDLNQTGGGKINWPLAVVASVVLHVVGIGLVLFFAGVFDSGGSSPAPQPAVGAVSGPTDAEVEQVTPVEALPEPSTTTSPNVSAVPPTQTDPAVPSGPATYTVKPGDSLSRIAKNHGCTVKELADLNGFSVNKMLDVGETLKVPR